MMYDNVDVVVDDDDDDDGDDDDDVDDDDDNACRSNSCESFDCLKSMIICYRLVFSNWGCSNLDFQPASGLRV